jgi:hypothetical protein
VHIFLVRETGSILVLEGDSTMSPVDLLVYSHRTYNKDKKAAQPWTEDRMPTMFCN